MLRSLPHRPVVVLTATILVAALASALAVAADRVPAKRTPARTLAPAMFTISGTVTRPLRPGTSEPLELRLTNPHRWDLRVVDVMVSISVDPAHDEAGCSRMANYRQTRTPPGSFPLILPANSTRTLRQLGVRRPRLITMLNLPTNQDACKGAQLRLRFAGRAARDHRPFVR